jgi:hypothetical protein
LCAVIYLIGQTPGTCSESASSVIWRARAPGSCRAGRLTFLTRFFPSYAYLDEFLERRVVPFREAVAMALDGRITESVSKVAGLAVVLTLGHRT